MNETQEYIRIIEKLGDDLKPLIDLVESIRSTTEVRYGINSNTLGIIKISWHLRDLEGYYTDFHKNIFKELKKEEIKNV